MTEKKTLEELLASAEGKSFLFLGREGLFTHEEIQRFLKKHGITMSKYLEDTVVATIEPLNLNPVEEDISNDAYAKKIPSFSLNAFEKVLSKGINDDELLMAIKLSNDQERVFRLLGNPNLSEALFVKLLMMYTWHDNEEDNREDRDTIMYTLKRYIDIKPNESDLHYSYLTLRRLATEATNPRLLQALISFPNFDFLIRGKEKVTLRETIARNTYIDQEVITKLVSLRDPKIDIALAANTASEQALLQTLLAKDNAIIHEALASNTNIDDSIFIALLQKEAIIVQLLLWFQPIDTARLALVDTQGLAPDLFATIGTNEQLEHTVIETLIDRDNPILISHLAGNNTLNHTQLEKIYAKGIQDSFQFLAINPASSVPMLEMLYLHYDEEEIHLALAANRRTPEHILRELFERNSFEIHRCLASNASIPLDILDILKIDTRLQNELAKNPILIKRYETVLDYDKKAVQF